MKRKKGVPLASLTTFRIGGPADFLIEVDQKEELKEAFFWAKNRRLPLTVLGGGSNVLVSDKGIRGVVVVNRTKGVRLKRKEKGVVGLEVESGVKLGGLIKRLLKKGITGLERFVGIPGSIGGAIFNNIHGKEGFLFQAVVESVEVLDEEGKVKKVSKEECQFDYDFSRFQKSGEIILAANLLLPQTDLREAKRVVEEWGRKKILSQPQNSAGCVFKNLTLEQQQTLGLPTVSMGYVIDKILKLKGKQIGGAKISEKHANFIVNETGRAKAADVLALIRLVKRKCQEKLGFEPELEIFLLGEF